MFADACCACAVIISCVLLLNKKEEMNFWIFRSSCFLVRRFRTPFSLMTSETQRKQSILSRKEWKFIYWCLLLQCMGIAAFFAYRIWVSGGAGLGYTSSAVSEKRASVRDGSEELCELMRNPPPGRLFLVTLGTCLFDFQATLWRAWVEHYLQLGVPAENFIVIFNYLPDTSEQQKEPFLRVLEAHNMSHIPWAGKYSNIAAVPIVTQALRDRNVLLNDWVIFADQDEFHQLDVYTPPPDAATTKDERELRRRQRALPSFHTTPPKPHYVMLKEHMEQYGYTAAYGAMIDRVSRDGRLNAIEDDAQRSIFQQFPLACDVTGGVQETACLFKVMMARGFLRTWRGNHWLAARDGCPPARVRRKFGNRREGCCPSSKAPVKFDELFGEQWREIVPTANLSACANERGLLNNYVPRANFLPHTLAVHHFKWVQGVIDRAVARADYYVTLGAYNWRHSAMLMRHYERHFGICVKCAKTRCVEADSATFDPNMFFTDALE